MWPQWVYVVYIFTLIWIVPLTHAQDGLGPADPVEDGLCDHVLGHYPPLATGKCAAGTAWLEEFECCVKCVYCPPGTRKASTGCHGECLQCSEGSFSSPPYNLEEYCNPCTDCGALYRHTARSCAVDLDTQCGSCLSGYFQSDQDHHPSSPLALCKPCTANDKHEDCNGFLSSSSALDSGNGTEDVKNGSILPAIIGAVIGLIALVLALLVVIYMIYRRKQKTNSKHDNHPATDEEQHPLQDSNNETVTKAPVPPKNGLIMSEPEDDEFQTPPVVEETPGHYLECPTIEIVPPQPVRTPSTSSRRVQFADSENISSTGPVDASSEEDVHVAGDKEDFFTAVGYQPDNGQGGSEDKRSFQSIDDDEDAGAAAWGFFSGSKSPKPSPKLNRLKQEHATQEFSSLPQSLKGEYGS